MFGPNNAFSVLSADSLGKPSGGFPDTFKIESLGPEQYFVELSMGLSSKVGLLGPKTRLSYFAV